MLERQIEKPLTLKERKLLQAYIETGSKTEAARQAGYKNLNDAWVVLARPHVNFAFQRIMEEKGLSDGKLLDMVVDGCKATRVISANVIMTGTKPGTLEPVAPAAGEALANGKTFDFIEVPDHDARFKWGRLAFELSGRLKKAVGEDGSGGITIQGNVNFIQAMIQRAQEVQ